MDLRRGRPLHNRPMPLKKVVEHVLGGAEAEAQGKLKAGTHVMANVGGKDFHPGTILEKNADGSYSIQFDVGVGVRAKEAADIPSNINVENIRFVTRAAVGGAPLGHSSTAPSRQNDFGAAVALARSGERPPGVLPLPMRLCPTGQPGKLQAGKREVLLGQLYDVIDPRAEDAVTLSTWSSLYLPPEDGGKEVQQQFKEVAGKDGAVSTVQRHEFVTYALAEFKPFPDDVFHHVIRQLKLLASNQMKALKSKNAEDIERIDITTQAFLEMKSLETRGLTDADVIAMMEQAHALTMEALQVKGEALNKKAGRAVAASGRAVAAPGASEAAAAEAKVTLAKLAKKEYVLINNPPGESRFAHRDAADARAKKLSSAWVMFVAEGDKIEEIEPRGKGTSDQPGSYGGLSVPTKTHDACRKYVEKTLLPARRGPQGRRPKF